MTQVPLISGVKSNRGAEFDRSLPVNLEPVILTTNLSNGQLRLTAGTSAFGTGPGADRAGVNWNGICYRAMGSKLVRVSEIGQVTVIGEIGDGEASFTYSFDRLAIRSGGNLFYYDGTVLTQVTDPDLGTCLDLEWFDGYFVSTDGMSIIVTELIDPTAIEGIRYGSAENDPDMIKGLLRLRDELYAFGRHSIQIFQNVGSTGFPFRSVDGAIIPYGCVSASAKCLMGDTIAFVGSSRGEALGVYLVGQGTAEKISNKEVDDYLAAVASPEQIRLENRTSRDERRILVHLPDRTLCFFVEGSKASQDLIWCELQSNGTYRIRNAIQCYNKTIVGDLNSGSIGLLSYDDAHHFGEDVEWKVEPGLLYNDGMGAIINQVELVCLTGRNQGQSSVFFSVSTDGLHWSNEASLSYSQDTRRRMAWRPHFRFINYMAMRFRGIGSAIVGIARLEASIEALK